MTFSELIALYLFLGGTGAGAFAVLSAVDLFMAFRHARNPHASRTPSDFVGCRSRSTTHRRIGMVVYSAAFIMIAVGLLCLLADLGRPQAFYLLFVYPTPSFMSIGAFALTLMTVCLIVALAESVLVLGPAWERAALLAKGVGVVLAVIVMVYTGMLLHTVVAVSLWRSVWLPVLFLLSALSCGIAVVMLGTCVCEGYQGARRWLRALTAVDAVVIVVELIAAVAYAVTVDAANPSRPFAAMLFGASSWLFWLGFVGCGMVAPFALEIDALLIRRSEGTGVAVTTAALVLIGGICLRFALVIAGIQTAV